MRAFLVSVDYTDLLAVTLPYNRHHFDEVVIVTSTADEPNVVKLCWDLAPPANNKPNLTVIATDLFYARGATFNKWAALEYGLDVAGRHGWMCVAPWTDVKAVQVKAASRKLYTGYLTTIRTASGKLLSLTPEHKLLTGRGWLEARHVNEDEQLFHVVMGNTPRAPDINYVPSMIGDVIDSAFKRSPATAKTSVKEFGAVSSRMNLECDFFDCSCNIDIVVADGKLRRDLEPRTQKFNNFWFKTSDVGLSYLFGQGDFFGNTRFSLLANKSRFNSSNTFGNNFRSLIRSSDFSGLAMGSGFIPTKSELFGNCSAATVNQLTDGTEAVASYIACDYVVSINRTFWSGHVYDLSTVGGWYTSNGIITHNCLMDADVLWPKGVQFEEFEPGSSVLSLHNGNEKVQLLPGCLYSPLRHMCEDVNRLVGKDGKLVPPPEDKWQDHPVHRNTAEWAGYTQIFHASDPHLGPAPWHDVDWKHAGGADSFFQRKWPASNKVRPPFRVLHLGPAGHNWFGRSTPYVDGTRPPDAGGRYQRNMAIWRERQRLSRQGKDPFTSEKLP